MVMAVVVALVFVVFVVVFVAILAGQLLSSRTTGSASLDGVARPTTHQLGQELVSESVTWTCPRSPALVLAEIRSLTGPASVAPEGALTLDGERGDHLLLAWANRISAHWRVTLRVTSDGSGSQVTWTPTEWKKADGLVVALQQMQDTRDRVESIATGSKVG